MRAQTLSSYMLIQHLVPTLAVAVVLQGTVVVAETCDLSCFNGGKCVLNRAASDCLSPSAPYDKPKCMCPEPISGECFYGTQCESKVSCSASNIKSCNWRRMVAIGKDPAPVICSTAAEPTGFCLEVVTPAETPAPTPTPTPVSAHIKVIYLTPAPTPPPVHLQSDRCLDGMQNGDETSVDCGGSSCAACSDPNQSQQSPTSAPTPAKRPIATSSTTTALIAANDGIVQMVGGATSIRVAGSTMFVCLLIQI